MLLSDYDRKDLSHDEQVAMATMRALGLIGTRRMKVAAKAIVASLNTDSAFEDIAKNFSILEDGS